MGERVRIVGARLKRELSDPFADGMFVRDCAGVDGPAGVRLGGGVDERAPVIPVAAAR